VLSSIRGRQKLHEKREEFCFSPYERGKVKTEEKNEKKWGEVGRRGGTKEIFLERF